MSSHTFQSIMGPRTENVSGASDSVSLRIGQVAAPYSPITDATAFDVYIDRCLKSWTVDVVLDKGEYYSACRILVPQGNLREGMRRMFKFPHGTYSEKFFLGDTVIVGFIESNPLKPIILGALNPDFFSADPTKQVADWEALGLFVSKDRNEWLDRHDVVDYTTIPANPLASNTEKRDSGVNITESHVVYTNAGKTTNTADNTQSLVLQTDVGANVLTKEHVVERGDASNRLKNSVYKKDDSAKDLKSYHQTVNSGKLTASVSIEDLEARVVHLQHIVEVQAGVLNTLLIESKNATLFTISHDTTVHRAALISDSDNKNTALVSTDKTTGSNASLGFAQNSEVTLRRANSGGADSFMMLEQGGEVSVRSAFGATVRLSSGKVAVKSGKSSVVVDDSAGVRLVSSDGGFFTVTGSKAVISSAALAVAAPFVSFNTGAMRIGPSGATYSIPAAEKLYDKLFRLEDRVTQLEAWGAGHVHPSDFKSAIVPPNQGSSGSFVLSEIVGDSLKALKAD